MIEWQFKHFEDLNTAELFALMKLRVDIFVVEQHCPYPELDKHDNAADTVHLLGMSHGQLATYARAMPGQTPLDPATTSVDRIGSESPNKPVVRIGRVVVAPDFRAQGLGRILMQEMISYLDTRYPDQQQYLAAQITVQALYSSLGFIPVSDGYTEDGIPHIDMLRLRSPQPEATSVSLD